MDDELTQKYTRHKDHECAQQVGRGKKEARWDECVHWAAHDEYYEQKA